MPLKTLYFGGGTPSLLSAEQLKDLTSFFDKASDCEISMELDPGTFDLAKLEALDRQISRFSMGIQTFERKEFDMLGRGHSFEAIEESIKVL